mmetsp:Transcript_4974/g.10341  ORF Transcript_4974/g.10341 Transcript_4974/m.10341 type:complete len:208 (+) Transcript_4974:258-881(+)
MLAVVLVVLAGLGFTRGSMASPVSPILFRHKPCSVVRASSPNVVHLAWKSRSKSWVASTVSLPSPRPCRSWSTSSSTISVLTPGGSSISPASSDRRLASRLDWVHWSADGAVAKAGLRFARIFRATATWRDTSGAAGERLTSRRTKDPSVGPPGGLRARPDGGAGGNTASSVLGAAAPMVETQSITGMDSWDRLGTTTTSSRCKRNP